MDIDLNHEELILLIQLVHAHGMKKHRAAEPERIETPLEHSLIMKLNGARESKIVRDRLKGHVPQ